ncbi:MAG: hypothetical protein LBT49_01195 [Prevotellaceae bacterium]|nr:hypothetical protein [Prevotellaceae bacterium]
MSTQQWNDYDSEQALKQSDCPTHLPRVNRNHGAQHRKRRANTLRFFWL